MTLLSALLASCLQKKELPVYSLPASDQTKDDIAFAYAVAKDTNQKFYSYVAATTAYGKTDNDPWIRIICRTLEPSTAQPAAPMLQESQQFIFWRQDAKLVCSSGTESC